MSLGEEIFLEEELFTVFDVKSIPKSEISLSLKIENQDCCLQLDTGCAFSLAPKDFYDRFCSHILSKPTAVLIATYKGEKIQPLGQIAVKKSYAGSEYFLPLLIVRQGSGALLGKNWLMYIICLQTNPHHLRLNVQKFQLTREH